jgi:hypothetical protein
VVAEPRGARRPGPPRRPPGPPAQILRIVRTGGQLAAWPDRRGYLERAIASLEERVTYAGPTVARVLFSDWPGELRPELDAIAERHGYYVVGNGNAGFTASMSRSGATSRPRSWSFDYVWLAEDDFVYDRDVDLGELVDVLARRPHLVQMALLRDAFYEAERAAGGILGHPLDAFDRVRADWGHGFEREDLAWLEHRRFFTLNPTLFPRSLTGRPWPHAEHSEAVFGRQLFADPDARSALWGDGEAWVSHLGAVRAGTGY